MNKILNFLFFISALFVVVGLTSCSPTVNINPTPSTDTDTNTDPSTMEINTVADLKTFLRNGSSIGKLMANFTVTELLVLTDGKDKILDLNGKTITSTANNTSIAYPLKIEGTSTKLEIKDSTTDKNGAFISTAADIAVHVGGSAKLTLSSGKILAKKASGIAVHMNAPSAQFEMKGGWVYAADGFGLNDAFKGTAVKIANGTAKFSDGKLGGKTGIEVGSSGKVSSIDGITVDVSEFAIHNYGIIGNTAEDGIKGGTFNVTATSGSAFIYGIDNYGSNAYVKMTGGDFYLQSGGFPNVHYRSIRNTSGSGDITGGSFETSGADGRYTTGLTVSSAVTFSVSN